MASSTDPKASVDILEMYPEDEKEHFISRYVLDTKMTLLDKELKDTGISISKSAKGKYFASFQSESEKCENVLKRILHNESFGLTAAKHNLGKITHEQQDYRGKVEIYTSSLNNTWIVGEKEIVRKMIQGERSQIPRTGSEIGSSNNITPEFLLNFDLSQEDKATIYLNDLWEQSVLKQTCLLVEKDDACYDIQIRISKDSFGLTKDIRDLLSDKKSKLKVSKLSVITRKVELMMSENVRKYIDKKLNRGRRRPDCVWYLNQSDNTVVLYCNSEEQKRHCTECFDNFVKSNSIPVSAVIFRNGKMQQDLQRLEARMESKAKMYLNSSANTLFFVFTDDLEYTVEREVKSLVKTKSETFNDKYKRLYCKMHFPQFRDSADKKHGVLLKEEEKGDKYGFVIQGREKDVDDVYREILTNVGRLKSDSRNFKTDDDENGVRKILTEKIDEPILVEGISTQSASKIRDFQREFISHDWQLLNGNAIKLVNYDRWLPKCSIVVKICIEERKDGQYTKVHQNFGSILLSLPPWNDNENQEKSFLQSALDTLLQLVSSKESRGQKYLSIALSEPERNGWSWRRFLKVLLVAMDKGKTSFPLVVLEPSEKRFNKATTVVENYALSLYSRQRINIRMKKGALSKEKAGAIVNSTSYDLQLTSGAVSRSLLKEAGEALQSECKEILLKRNRPSISSKEVVVTKGYNLPCEYVFHGALADWHEQTLSDFVMECLRRAEELRLTSVAFPSLGTGNLKYPPATVAKIMYNTVNSYAKNTNIGSLKEVVFVIFHQDDIAFKAFAKEDYKFSSNANKDQLYVATKTKCPSPYCLKITVVGTTEEIGRIFCSVESILDKHKEIGLVDDEEQTYSGDESEQEQTTPSNTLGREDSREEKGDQRTSDYHDDWNEQNGTVCLTLTHGEIGSYEQLVMSMAKFNVQESQITWSPYNPNEARIKMLKSSDAEDLIEQFNASNLYSATKPDTEAVTNIRAKLSAHVIKLFLQRESLQNQLKKQSGVDMLHEGCNITLTGCLTEVSSARMILKKWIEGSFVEVPVMHLASAKNKQSDEFSTAGNTTSLKGSLKATHRMTELDEETVIIESEPSDVRTVLAKDNSLQIFVKPEQKKKADVTPKARAKNNNLDADPKGTGAAEGVHVSTNTDVNKANDDTLMMVTKEGLKIYVYEGDICNLRVNGIVNSSNEFMKFTKGLAYVISSEKGAGSSVVKECEAYVKANKRLRSGDVFVSGPGNLEHYMFILHVCSPIWKDDSTKQTFCNELQKVLQNAFQKATENGMMSLAIPAVGSGGRGGPKQVCFETYSEAVLAFSSDQGTKSSLKEIHFVDVDKNVVNMIQTAFLLATDQSPKRDVKLNKIPEATKQTFVSYISNDEQTPNFFNAHFDKDVHVVICDGALFSCPKHRHLTDSKLPISKFDDIGVVVTEDTDFRGQSKSSAHCLQRGGNDISKNYHTIKTSKEKKKVGKVLETFGDHQLNFGHVLFAILPQVDPKSFDRSSSESQHLIKKAEKCIENILQMAEKCNINHMCMPLLLDDFYESSADWMLDKSIHDMVSAIRNFAVQRNKKYTFQIHVALNAKVKLFHSFKDAVEKKKAS